MTEFSSPTGAAADCLGAGPAQAVTVVTNNRSATVVSSMTTGSNPLVRNAGTATEWASTGSVLRP